jgi:hypothetical protein
MFFAHFILSRIERVDLNFFVGLILTELGSVSIFISRIFSIYAGSNGGFIKGILRGFRCTKSLRVLFLHQRLPSWTTLVLYSAVLIFYEPALILF